MAWYRAGTVSLTNGSTTVTGLNTNFINQNQGWILVTEQDATLHEISTIVSSTEITLKEAVTGATASGLDYFIIPTQSLNADLVEKINEMITLFNNTKASWDSVFEDFNNTVYESWLTQPGNSGLTYQDFLDDITGPAGPEGDSAYEVWLSANNTGTVTDYLDDISAGVVTAVANSVAEAATSASEAAISANNAAASEASIAATANTSTVQAEIATTAANNALTSESNAAASANAALTSESNAAASANAASNDAATATTQAGIATTQANNASISASEAAASANSAVTARDDLFTRYIGSYANDAAANASGYIIGEGLIYWDSTVNALKIYDGTTWETAVFDTAGAMIASNNLSDLANTDIAISNLGLGTSAAIDVGTSNNQIVQLDGTAKLPAVDGSQLTNLPASGAMNLLLTQTFTSVSSVDFTSQIDGTYDSYYVIYNGITFSDSNVNFGLRAGSGSFDSGFGDYGTVYLENYGTILDASTTDNHFIISFGAENSADQNISGFGYIHDVNNSSSETGFMFFTNVPDNSGGAARSYVISTGSLLSAGTIDRCQFRVDAGNFSGTISLYGISQ